MFNQLCFLIRNFKFFRTFKLFRYIYSIHYKITPKALRNKREEVLRRQESATLTSNDLVELFKELKLEKNIFLHSGLGRFNRLKNRNKTLFEALTIYEFKNLLIPFFPVKTIYFNDFNIYNYYERRTGSGSFSEYINNSFKNDLLKSIHISHTTMAIGINKLDLISTHNNSLTPFDKKSPFYKAIMYNFDALLIGVDLNSLTSIHVSEDILEDIFLPLYSSQFINVNIYENELFSTKIKTKTRHLSHKIRNVELLRDAFLKSKVMRIVKFDNYEIIAINIRGLTFVTLNELLKGNSIYGYLKLSLKEKKIIKNTISTLEQEVYLFEKGKK